MKDGDIVVLKWRLKSSLKNCVAYDPDWIYWIEKLKGEVN